MKRRGVVSLLSLAGLLLAVSAGPAHAQSATLPAQCGADSLVLLSPAVEGIRIQLSSPGERFGAYIQWPEVSDAEGTCTAVLAEESMSMAVRIAGAYADKIDRLLHFVPSDSGLIGSSRVKRLSVRWNNVYVSRSGLVSGSFNVANSGGLLRLDRDSGWQRMNEGLPQYLSYTNILALADSPQPDGPLLLHLGGDASPGLDRGRGLYERVAGVWSRVAPDRFPDDVRINRLACSPDSGQAYAVGTADRGLYITHDGGESFSGFLSGRRVTALSWAEQDQLLAAVSAQGLYLSADDGMTVSKLRPGPLVPHPTLPDSLIPPSINELVVDPLDHQHILAAIDRYALYHSTDGGVHWSPMTGNWLPPGSPAYNGVSVAISEDEPPVVILGTEKRGLFRSGNGGQTWQAVGTELADLASDSSHTWIGSPVVKVLFDPLTPGRVFAFADLIGLVVSEDAGQTWAAYPDQPSMDLALDMVPAADGSGDLMLATTGGGIYTPDTPIPLSMTINKGQTDPEYRDLEFGLEVALDGTIGPGEEFDLVAQDYQGYAVWRSTPDDPLDMKMIGLYDKTNPETCIEGFCGDENYTVTPNCFGEKRAACFDFGKQDSVVFFDNDVYNGFTYYYAVTTFDYGNLAGVEPPANANEMFFSARFPSPNSLQILPDVMTDPNAHFGGEGNMTAFQVNVASKEEEGGPEIYVYPNPLRRAAGFPGQEGEGVIFTNLPPHAHIQVFTMDGDHIADLGEEAQEGANMYWVTRNEDGNLLAPGIYIWKVEMPKREEYWGKLVIIR
jgi:photosystem II stability/assembly factor-like uncharacterized protein